MIIFDLPREKHAKTTLFVNIETEIADFESRRGKWKVKWVTCIILCYILQKQEKPSLQYVSDIMSFQDERHLFFLGCEHPDKNGYLSSLALVRAITYFVSKNTSFYQSLKNKDYHRHLYV
jgi:hypothetical protein